MVAEGKINTLHLVPMALTERRALGNRGEDLAAVFFLGKGFRVMERNWSRPFGEIDLILEKEGKVHFVEVKTRKSLEFGYPEESITRSKLRHLAKAIEVYLIEHPLVTAYQVDALAILVMEEKVEYHYVEFIL